MTTLTLANPPAHLQYLLRLADDQLVLGHRLSEWTGHAPMLEEDIALANIGLDHIGAARSLYDRASAVHGEGLTEDDYAYRRDARGWLNLLLVERPNGDFAQTIARQFFFSAFALPHWQALTASADETLAAVAAKSEKEARYHVRHAGDWFLRLGDGTAESHRRMTEAVQSLWPYTGEMFEADPVVEALVAEGVAVDPRTLHAEWTRTVEKAFAATGISPPAVKHFQTGGRTGRHTEHLGYILADLQFLQRAYPGGRLVTDLTERAARAWRAAATVHDPEVPVLTIEDLGVLRAVREEGETVVATITPTYSGCPAMDMIAVHVELALRNAGFDRVKVERVLSPAWTTDWMTSEGREKLRAYGIAPPEGSAGRGALFGADPVVPCPHCGSTRTARISDFGSTACKALLRCESCREPFDYFKCH